MTIAPIVPITQEQIANHRFNDNEPTYGILPLSLWPYGDTEGNTYYIWGAGYFNEVLKNNKDIVDKNVLEGHNLTPVEGAPELTINKFSEFVPTHTQEVDFLTQLTFGMDLHYFVKADANVR